MKNLVYLLLLPFLAAAAPVPDSLLDKLQIPRSISDNDFDTLIRREWFQNRERWEFQPNLEELKEELRPIFSSMGYLDAKVPQKKHYTYTLVIGSTLWTMKKRITYLESLLSQGLETSRIIFLSGTRKLLHAEKEGLPEEITTEHEMIRYLYTQSNLNLPADFAVGEYRSTPDGPLRPGTYEALQAWLKTNPPPGTCLAISNQPYLPFQETILKRTLPDTFPSEITGEKAVETWTVALILDTIARSFIFAPKRKQIIREKLGLF